MLSNWVKANIKPILELLITLFVILYGAGEYYSWWDAISKRTLILEGYERLSSGEGWPKQFICNGEHEFIPLLKIALQNTNSDTFKNNIKKVSKGCFSVAGGGFIETPVPENWPRSVFVPESTTVFFIFNVSKEDDRFKDAFGVQRVCSLGDIKRWVDESRNSFRFYVATGFIGALSLVSAVFGFLEARTRPK